MFGKDKHTQILLALERLESNIKNESTIRQQDMSAVKDRLRAAENTVADFPEIKQLTSIISENIKQQSQSQNALAKIQEDFAKTQIMQAGVLEKISANLDRQSEQIMSIEKKIEVHKEQDATKIELTIAQMRDENEQKRQEILSKTYEDKREIKNLIENVLNEFKILEKKIDSEKNRGKVDLINVFTDNFKVFLGGAIVLGLKFLFTGAIW